MKKRRGLRIYFRRLEKHNDLEGFAALISGKESWFDFGHTHYDWEGLGINSWKKRKPHLDTLFRNFDLYPNRLKLIEKPFQLFIQLYDYDSSDDAIFIHTENPNQDNFPYKIDLMDKCTLKNQELIKYINQKGGFEKLFGIADNEGYCLLYKKGIGESLK
ncbi:hypothetical protein ACD591_08045 [Rufibacter glacialis]|uniref:Uncharacterized protein n=1 Tax=Rufibacter glacialis TaxID=1259555 RepID=A0A5M8QRW1_9BACT|nr:hypothetical protein [Rufibacter glacialis]KAA6437998.1 hypothetical protein FOE74_00880 [Rufibacter glacialis]GGK89669.1 hypothetical protein GCM10011405_41720 [Rufibacter glacialis]